MAEPNEFPPLIPHAATPVSETRPWTTKGYMCAITWNSECGNDPEGSKIFPTEQDAVRNLSCVRQEGCALVEVELTILRIVRPGRKIGDG